VDGNINCLEPRVEGAGRECCKWSFTDAALKLTGVDLLVGGGGLERIDEVNGELRPPRREVVMVGERLRLLGTTEVTSGK